MISCAIDKIFEWTAGGSLQKSIPFTNFSSSGRPHVEARKLYRAGDTADSAASKVRFVLRGGQGSWKT